LTLDIIGLYKTLKKDLRPCNASR